MDQTISDNPNQKPITYDDIFRVLNRDGWALRQGGRDYSALRSSLLEYFKDPIFAMLYKSGAINFHGNRFLSAIDYIKLLQSHSETDSGKVKDLKVTLIKALIEKLGSNARYFIPETDIDLYDVANSEVEQPSRSGGLNLKLSLGRINL